MRKPGPLSVAFVESHPEQAAQVLAALPAPDTVAFFAASPARLSAAVVRHLPPQYAARCADALEEDVLSELVAALGPQAAAGVMQYLAPAKQSRVLDGLSPATAVALRLIVGYARDTAGACMDPFPLALPGETPVGEALDALRSHASETDDVVFVVGEERRLTGRLSAAMLLRASPREALIRVMRQPVPSVSALTPLVSAREHPGWLEATSLAVVERQDRLMGALHRTRLEAALAQRVNMAPEPAASEALLGLGGAYWQVTVSLSQLAVNLVPRIRPVARDKENENGR